MERLVLCTHLTKILPSPLIVVLTRLRFTAPQLMEVQFTVTTPSDSCTSVQRSASAIVWVTSRSDVEIAFCGRAHDFTQHMRLSTLFFIPNFSCTRKEKDQRRCLLLQIRTHQWHYRGNKMLPLKGPSNHDSPSVRRFGGRSSCCFMKQQRRVWHAQWLAVHWSASSQGRYPRTMQP